MKSNFFVMLTTRSGGFTPLMICTDIMMNKAELAIFSTKEKARESAKNSELGKLFGFEVFEYGCGDKSTDDMG